MTTAWPDRRISWFDHAKTVGRDRRDEAENEIREALGAVPWVYALIRLDLREPEVWVKFRSPDISWRWPGKAGLRGLSRSDVREAMSDMVGRLVLEHPEIADLMRESEAA